jgi:phosphoglycolate phosphatase
MTKHTLLLFDLDGTLTDPKPGITQSVQYALEHIGIVVDDPDTLTPFIGPPLLESFQRYYGLSAEDAMRAVAWYREAYAEKRFSGNAVYPGIPNLLAALGAQEKRLMVATSKPTSMAEEILAHFALSSFFEQVIGSFLDGTRTAKAEVIAHALSLAPNISNEQVAMIGDREHDIIGARANGIDAIAVEYGYGPHAELVAAQPTYLAPTVADLATLLLA